MQLRLADALLAAQRRGAAEARELQPAVRERVGEALEAMQSAVKEAMEAAEQLDGKLGALREAMGSDGMVGIPAMCVEGDAAPKASPHLSCIDNSELWSAVASLKSERAREGS